MQTGDYDGIVAGFFCGGRSSVGYSNITIQGCGFVSTGMEGYYPSAFAGRRFPTAVYASNVSITDSFAVGKLKSQSDTDDQILFGYLSVSSLTKYAGVYLYDTSAEKKVYATGFTDSEWICGAINNGYPALRWNTWAGGNITTTSVETFLKGKGFAVALE